MRRQFELNWMKENWFRIGHFQNYSILVLWMIDYEAAHVCLSLNWRHCLWWFTIVWPYSIHCNVNATIWSVEIIQYLWDIFQTTDIRIHVVSIFIHRQSDSMQIFFSQDENISEKFCRIDLMCVWWKFDSLSAPKKGLSCSSKSLGLTNEKPHFQNFKYFKLPVYFIAHTVRIKAILWIPSLRYVLKLDPDIFWTKIWKFIRIVSSKTKIILKSYWTQNSFIALKNNSSIQNRSYLKSPELIE